MLATPAAKRVHHQVRPGVIDTGIVVFGVADDHVGGRQIPERAVVGHERGGQGVEGHVFAIFGPKRVAGDAEQHFVRTHLLDHPAGFNRLAGIDVAFATVFVAAPHPARHLSVLVPHQLMIPVGRLQIGRVTALLVVRGGFAETLRDVDVVPVGQVIGLPPVGRVPVNFLGQLQQRRVAGVVV